VFKRSLVVLVVALLAAAAAVLAPAGTPPKPVYPVTVTAANGKVTLRSQPRRIVSLSPTATESLFAIGAGPQVIAVDDQSGYPNSAPRTKLSGYTPNVEAIAAYHPDLVIVSNDLKGLIAALGKLRVPVLLEPAVATLNGTYAQIRQLGKATGHSAAAARLARSMRKRIAALVASAGHPSASLSVYHELTPDYYSATSKTFIGRVYALFGLRNIADAADATGTGYPQLSGEYILEANPDLIVLADTRCCAQTLATVAARPGWSRIAAVRNHAIVRIDDSIASRWGPRVVNFVRAVSLALHTVER
jgi:iron complex transport system substrate-binding protein